MVVFFTVILVYHLSFNELIDKFKNSYAFGSLKKTR